MCDINDDLIKLDLTEINFMEIDLIDSDLLETFGYLEDAVQFEDLGYFEPFNHHLMPDEETHQPPFTEFDVLCGRGGINKHKGNQAYLKQKEAMQVEYKQSSNQRKYEMSWELVRWVQARGGRFLRKADRTDNSSWYEIDDHEARKRCSQALRDASTNKDLAKIRAMTEF